MIPSLPLMKTNRNATFYTSSLKENCIYESINIYLIIYRKKFVIYISNSQQQNREQQQSYRKQSYRKQQQSYRKQQLSYREQQQSIQEYNNKQEMDLQKPKKRCRGSQKQEGVQQKRRKDLLRLERDIFALKKSQQKECEYVIRRLMQKKEKPQISMTMQSPVLSRLKQFMPMLHKSNQQLQQRPIEESQKIDVRLQQCESSSSSQSESDNQQNPLMEQIDEEHFLDQQNELQDQEIEGITNNETNQVINTFNQMDVQVKSLMLNNKNLISNNHHNYKPSSLPMDEEQHCTNHYKKNKNQNFNQSTLNTKSNTNDNLVEINFLTYPYLNQEQIDHLNQNTQVKTTNPIEEHIIQLRKKQQQKILIQEINSPQDKTQMEH